jgi:serine/tyrosine/threonine adenylyltransferase
VQFEATFLTELPVDPESGPRLRQVSGATASRVRPTPVREPRLVAQSHEMASELGLSEAEVASQDFVQVLGGNRLLDGMDPYAACYGGHQFGNWAGQLGDGRAIVLGETRGQRGDRWELQLKGPGPTPYSRRADGRAVLRSSLREFLCSEAMFHLGVPTTRALSLVTTGELVERDMFYDGHPQMEQGAIVCRMAPTFLRFGNFEIFADRDDQATLRKLANYTLRHFYPGLLPKSGEPGRDEYLALFAEVSSRTARMVMEWMRVGFVHGVMNTDNMSILGLTIDYGPYGFLDNFDTGWTPNTTDAGGRRYRYGTQPRVAQWNLLKLAEALYPLIRETEPLEATLQAYGDEVERLERNMMMQKLGLFGWEEDADQALVTDLFGLLSAVETDMTLFFRGLGDVDVMREPELSDAGALRSPLEEAFYAPEARSPEYLKALDVYLRRLSARAREDLSSRDKSPQQRRDRMRRANPRFVPRNYLAQLAIDAAEKGDNSILLELLEAFRNPYDDQPRFARYAEKRPDWARTKAGCSMLSCSS